MMQIYQQILHLLIRSSFKFKMITTPIGAYTINCSMNIAIIHPSEGNWSYSYLLLVTWYTWPSFQWRRSEIKKWLLHIDPWISPTQTSTKLLSNGEATYAACTDPHAMTLLTSGPMVLPGSSFQIGSTKKTCHLWFMPNFSIFQSCLQRFLCFSWFSFILSYHLEELRRQNGNGKIRPPIGWSPSIAPIRHVWWKG